MRTKYASTTEEAEIRSTYGIRTREDYRLREGGFSHRALAAHVQLKSSTVFQVWKQWTNERSTTQKIEVDDGK